MMKREEKAGGEEVELNKGGDSGREEADLGVGKGDLGAKMAKDAKKSPKSPDGDLEGRGHLLQSAEWAEFEELEGNEGFALKGEGWSARGIVVDRGAAKYLYAKYGPTVAEVGKIAEAVEALRALGREKGAVFVRVEPVLAAKEGGIESAEVKNEDGALGGGEKADFGGDEGADRAEVGRKSGLVGFSEADLAVAREILAKIGAEAVRELNPEHTWVLSLAGEEAEILAGMESNKSRSWRNAAKHGMRVYSTREPEKVEILTKMLAAVAERDNFTPQEALHLRHQLEAGFATLYMVEYSAEMEEKMKAEGGKGANLGVKKGSEGGKMSVKGVDGGLEGEKVGGGSEKVRSSAKNAQVGGAGGVKGGAEGANNGVGEAIDAKIAKNGGEEAEWGDFVPIAAALVYDYNGVRYYAHAGTDENYKKLRAGAVLLVEMIVDAKKNGGRYFDFWGITTSEDKQHPWYGFTQFKKSFGGFQVDYLGCYDIPIDKMKYKLYKMGRKVNRGIRKIVK